MLEPSIIIFALFILGTIWGSFLLVVADRYIAGESSLKGRSYCSSCKKKLTAQELIPIISYILQRGRCTSCGSSLSVWYPLSEIFSGILFVLVLLPVVQGGSSAVIAGSSIAICSLLFILLTIDQKTMMLPDIFIGALTVVAIAMAYLQYRSFEYAAFGCLVGVGFLYFLWMVTGGAGLGFGDVKLTIPLGILLGAKGSITLLFIAFFIGGLWGIILLARKKATPKTAVPFGPFIAVGAMVIVLVPKTVDLFFTLLGVQ